MSNAPELTPVLAFIEILCCAASVIDRQGRNIGINDRLAAMMDRPHQGIEGRLVEDFYDEPTARALVHEGMARFSGSRETLEARIAQLVDVYDALVNARAYKPAWTQGEAMAHIRAHVGTMFDPELSEIFISICQAGKLSADQN